MDIHIQKKDVKKLIELALKEDIGRGDITSSAIFSRHDESRALIISKGHGYLCGTRMVQYVYEFIDKEVVVERLMEDGSEILPGIEIIRISGPTISVLTGERTALNFLQRMTGIATKTAGVVTMLKGSQIEILDTRKTLPGYRLLDKYAVKTGGGTNHRMGLYDMVMIKDNHIRRAGGIARAVQIIRNRYGSRYTVEVETSNLDEVREALSSQADIIMLDNMSRSQMESAIQLINKSAKIEISGNIDEDRISSLKDLSVDYISMGSLTHSVQAFDLSMRFL